MDRDGLGERLRAARKGKGWTQEDLAERAGVRALTVSRHERGASSAPSADTIAAFASALGVTTEYLLHGADLEVTRTPGLPPGLEEYLRTIELDDLERECLIAFGHAAQRARRLPTPQAYQGWLAMLRMQPATPTTP